jgi:hypothetical protein
VRPTVHLWYAKEIEIKERREKHMLLTFEYFTCE